jgi:hypothetical protein
LNPHRLLHTPLKRARLPFRHPDTLGPRTVHHMIDSSRCDCQSKPKSSTHCQKDGAIRPFSCIVHAQRLESLGRCGRIGDDTRQAVEERGKTGSHELKGRDTDHGNQREHQRVFGYGLSPCPPFFGGLNAVAINPGLGWCPQGRCLILLCAAVAVSRIEHPCPFLTHPVPGCFWLRRSGLFWKFPLNGVVKRL